MIKKILALLCTIGFAYSLANENSMETGLIGFTAQASIDRSDYYDEPVNSPKIDYEKLVKNTFFGKKPISEELDMGDGYESGIEADIYILLKSKSLAQQEDLEIRGLGGACDDPSIEKNIVKTSKGYVAHFSLYISTSVEGDSGGCFLEFKSNSIDYTIYSMQYYYVTDY